jgi:hypothetical protein
MMHAMNEAIEQKREKAGQTYAEKVNKADYQLVDSPFKKDTSTAVSGDDELQSKKWGNLMKDAAFYFDHPKIEDETKMRGKLQGTYDDLF